MPRFIREVEITALQYIPSESRFKLPVDIDNTIDSQFSGSHYGSRSYINGEGELAVRTFPYNEALNRVTLTLLPGEWLVCQDGLMTVVTNEAFQTFKLNEPQKR